jgi:hypothetical protein
MRSHLRRSIGLPAPARRPAVLRALASACLKNAQDRHGQRHGGRLVDLSDQVQQPVPAQHLAAVSDPYSCSFGGTKRVDAEKVRPGLRGARDGGDLQGPNELEPAQPRPWDSDSSWGDLGQPPLSRALWRSVGPVRSLVCAAVLSSPAGGSASG